VATCVLVVALLAFAGLAMDPRYPLRVGSAAVFALCGAIWGLRQLRLPAAIETELRIRDGTIWLRDRGAGPEEQEWRAQCVFAAPWLITFRMGSKYIRIWPDSLPMDAFRRVHACIRWERPGTTASAGALGANAFKNEIDP
jgi:hypothetical protein